MSEQLAFEVDRPRAVISASRRTDVPAYHARWLLDRLRDGRCGVAQPFTGQVRQVDLRPEAVIALVLWTRDPRPLLDGLPWITERGYPFTFLVTLNDFPAWLEPSAPHRSEVIGAIRSIRDRFGPDTVVWRYDPIVLTTATPPAYHLDQAAILGNALEGAVDECITSFVDLYRKTERHLVPALQRQGVDLLGEDVGRDRELVRGMRDALAGCGISLKLCCERELVGDGIPRAHCVDRDRLSRLVGERLRLVARPTRVGCGCHASIDIGGYDTCPRGCVYCYANQSPGANRALTP